MRRIIFSMFLSFLTILAFTQDVKVDFNDGEFFLAEEDYEEALYAFGKVYKNGYQDNAYINYRMGECLLFIPGRKTEAIPYLEEAEKSISADVKIGKLGETNAPPETLIYLGNAYRINMEVTRALESYEAFKAYIDPKDEITKQYVDQQIQACGNLVAATSAPVEYTVGNLGQLQAMHSNRYNMVISDDASTLAFMGKNPFYNGIYISLKENDVWGKPKNITPSVVSDGNMDVVALSSDGKKMLLAVSDEFTSNIYESVYENNRWNPAVSLGKPINSRYYESSAAYSPDGNSIYFSSNRKESTGGMDIYRSDMQEDGTWGEPVNLGPEINSFLNEDTPMLSPDGKRLYYSSQGHSTIGGFDVFYSDMQEDENWSETPVNMGYPLNTADDDMVLAPQGVSEEGKDYMFALSKLGDFDLFEIEMIDRNTDPVPVALVEEEEEVEEEVLVDTETEAPVIETPVTPPAPEAYYLRPIYFDFESYALDEEAKERLGQLTGILEKYPSIQLEITGHTDAVGSYAFNKWLSDERALAVYNYLLSKNIPDERMSTVGKSESEHVARNRTKDNKDAPDGRLLNRRVQFNVKLAGDVVVKMEKVDIPDHLKLD